MKMSAFCLFTRWCTSLIWTRGAYAPSLTLSQGSGKLQLSVAATAVAEVRQKKREEQEKKEKKKHLNLDSPDWCITISGAPAARCQDHSSVRGGNKDVWSGATQSFVMINLSRWASNRSLGVAGEALMGILIDANLSGPKSNSWPLGFTVYAGGFIHLWGLPVEPRYINGKGVPIGGLTDWCLSQQNKMITDNCTVGLIN